MAVQMGSGQSKLRSDVRNLACYRGGRMLFAGVNMAVAHGDALWLRGPNAIGKSSLIRIVAGLLPAYAGTLELDGGIALIDDRPALDMDMDVQSALHFWAQLDGTQQDVLGAIGSMGIAHLAAVPLRFLSQGQRKRAAMARVIASGAQLWLLDEPANGLDSDGVARLCQAIAAHRAGGGAIILASHIDLALPEMRTIDLADFAQADDGEPA